MFDLAMVLFTAAAVLVAFIAVCSAWIYRAELIQREHRIEDLEGELKLERRRHGMGPINSGKRHFPNSESND